MTTPENLDILALARGEPSAAEVEPDRTLGGYMEEHDRPPAFEGADGAPYSVDVEIEHTGDPARPYVGFLVFLRWADTGAGIMDHVESEDVSVGRTEADARAAALELSLHDVKQALDEAIDRRHRNLAD